MNRTVKALAISLVCLASTGALYGQTATIGGSIYTGHGTVTYVMDALGEPIPNWDTCYAPDPNCPALLGAKVMIEDEKGGAFVGWGTVTGNGWTASVPAPGEYVAVFSAPDHGTTSRSYSVGPGDTLMIDAYVPPLPLPGAALLHYVFFDSFVNGNDNGVGIEPGLNGVTVRVYNEAGDLLDTQVTGSLGSFTTIDGVQFGPGGIPAHGYVYFTGLPPGPVIVESDPTTVTQADNPHFSLNIQDDLTREWYLTYTEEGGKLWDLVLFPGDPGTELGFYLTWHGFIEKIGQLSDPQNPRNVNPGMCAITGTLLDADGNDPEEPFPVTQGGRVAPTNAHRENGEPYATGYDVEPNARIPDGAVALYTVGDFPVLVATTEATQPTHQNSQDGGIFQFHDLPIGEYEMFAWDLPLVNVPLMGVGVGIEPNCANQGVFPMLVPRFMARGQGHVMNGATAVPGAAVTLHYRSGSFKGTILSDANGWFNFDDLPEIEVMGFVTLDIPDKSTYRGKILTEMFDPDGLGPSPAFPVTHNSMNRYVQWMTYNYYVDLQVEDVPATTGDVHGVVFYDHLEPGTWVGDGAYDPAEEGVVQGVTVKLWTQAGGTGPYNVLVGSTTSGVFDEAAVLAQGWGPPGTWPINEIGGVFAGPSVGFYDFRDLPPGKYKVQTVPPAGMERSPRLPIKRFVRILAGKTRKIDLGLNTRPLASDPVGVPRSGGIEGGVFDDFNLDTNPLSLLWEEKAGIIGAPVGVRDQYNYLLGVMHMGNPYCYTESTVCPPGEPLGQGPEAEGRFAPGSHRYLGNDPTQPAHNPAYEPFELAYYFPQGGWKFEADWSLVPLTGSDMDLDGWTTFGLNGAVDCNDNDDTIYPMAPETVGDGIDQDCTGLDLEITIIRAKYKTARQRLIVWATSSEGAAAAGMMAEIAGRPPKTMIWNGAKSRWQKTFQGVTAAPAEVTVSGDTSDPATQAVTDIVP